MSEDTTQDSRGTAETSYGRVRGRDEGDGLVFRGIPFAAAPVGELRFRPPRRPERWGGTRDCVDFGPSCPQPPCAQSFFAPIAVVGDSDEACLSLNVWTPSLDRGSRPTMIWIHGGGFLWGSGVSPLYDGSAFSRDGVVFVSVNYRLNVFGFLCLDELVDGLAGSGNLGLLDQIMALQWVQENIGAFGGDPDNVTIFGESAGGCSVAELVAAPAAAGLFRRAIIQSGTTACHTRAGATAVARRALQLLGVNGGDLDALQAIPADRLVSLAEPLTLEAADLLGDETSGPVPMPFMPVIDGEVLVAGAHERLSQGTARDIDLLIGWCSDELTAYVADFDPEMALAMFQQLLTHDLRRRALGASEVIDAYRQARPGASDLELLVRAISDVTIRLPSLQLASSQLGHNNNVWMFEFAWPTPLAEGRLGAPHILEIPFVFDQLVAPDVHGPNPPQALASSVHGAWVSFAKAGTPLLPDGPQWPRYTMTHPTAMALKENPEMVTVLEAPLMSLWSEYLGQPVGKGTLSEVT